MRTLGRFFHRAGPGAGAKVAEVERELEQLNRSTEADFLRVLESLQALVTQSRGISEECSSLLGILHNDEAAQAERELRTTLDRASGAQQGAGEEARRLAEAAAAMRSVEKSVAGLGLTVRTFHALASAARIECARAGAGGSEFEGVADEVMGLATDLLDKSGQMLDACTAVRRTVQDATGTAAQMELRQGKELPRILETAAAGLAALSASREQRALLSRELGGKYEAISGAIGELVGALQYHDITRQQIEHVVEALREAAVEPGGGVAAVALLQAAQLRSTRRQFSEAAVRIRASLGRIAAEIREMAGSTAGLLAGAGGDAGASFRDLESAFAAVAASLASYAESSAALGAAAGTVGASIARMTNFAGDIEGIGMRMHRVSLNANVRAARLGAGGAALGAIAEEIQTGAGQSNRQTGSILEAIGTASACAGRLREGRERNSAGGARGRASELGKMQAVLEKCAVEARSRIAAIEKSGRELSEGVANLAGGFRAAEEMEQVVERCVKVLDGMAGAAPAVEVGQRIETLQARYTMDAERSVHEEIAAAGKGREAAPPPVPVPVELPPEPAGEALAAASSDDLGENVELF